MNSVHDRILMIMKCKNISRKEIIEKTNISPAKLSRILAGKQDIAHTDLIKLCTVLDVDSNFLLTGLDVSPDKSKSDYIKLLQQLLPQLDEKHLQLLFSYASLLTN